MNRRSALAGITGAAISACRRSPRLHPIRVSTLPRIISTPLYLADERGYFRDAGLQLDFQPLAEAAQITPLLAAGRIDVAFVGLVAAVFNAIARGARFRVVAARDVAIAGCTSEIYGSRRAFPRGFSDVRELKGKRVAVAAPANLTAFLLDTLLESGGLGRQDVHLLFMRLSESAPALAAGQLDALVDHNMGLSLPGTIAGPSIARLIPGFQYSYAQFGPSLIDADPAIGAAFLAAYFHGVRDFRAGTLPRAFDRIAIRSGTDPAVARSACRRRLSVDGRIDRSSVQRMIDWSVKKGFSQRLDPAQVIDNRFLERLGGETL